MATIFIVDDEPMLHELYGEILDINGHEIVANAYNGDEAVEMFKKMDEPPAIIIMDHRMPNMNGVETTKEILKFNSSIKIIFTSADTAVRYDALESGACWFMTKPFSIVDLLAAIERIAAEVASEDLRWNSSPEKNPS